MASFGDFSSISSSRSSRAASDRRSWDDWLPSAGSSSEFIGRMIFHRSDLSRKFMSRDWLRSAVFADADEPRCDHERERSAVTNCQGAGAMAHHPTFNGTSRMRNGENGSALACWESAKSIQSPILSKRGPRNRRRWADPGGSRTTRAASGDAPAGHAMMEPKDRPRNPSGGSSRSRGSPPCPSNPSRCSVPTCPGSHETFAEVPQAGRGVAMNL